MRMCNTQLTSVCLKLPMLHCALDTVTALCTTVTLLSVALTVDTRPTGESGDESGDGGHHDNGPPLVCTDRCQRCLNLTARHLGAPRYHHPIPRAQQRQKQQQMAGGFAHTPPFPTAQTGSGQFSGRGVPRLPEVASTPCLQHLLGHVTLLREEMQRLDSRMEAVLDSIGRRERS